MFYLMCCWVGDLHFKHIMGCLTKICERWVSTHEGTEWESSSLEYGLFVFITIKELAVFSGVPQCVIFSTWAIFVVGDFLIPIYFYI